MNGVLLLVAGWYSSPAYASSVCLTPWVETVCGCTWIGVGTIDLVRIDRPGGVIPSAQWSGMVAAAQSAWNGGVGELNSGYSFSVNDATPSSAPTNFDYYDPALLGKAQVGTLSHMNFQAACGTQSAACARAILNSSCTQTDAWMAVFYDRGQSWDDTAPSEGTTAFSAPQVMIHELGHLLGFVHDTSELALMNPGSPAVGNTGGDGPISTNFRLQAHEWEQMTNLLPDNSSGINLMVWKFAYDHTEDHGYETWTSDAVSPERGEDWDYNTCPISFGGSQLVPEGHMVVAVTANGISSPLETVVEFRLMDDGQVDCIDEINGNSTTTTTGSSSTCELP